MSTPPTTERDVTSHKEHVLNREEVLYILSNQRRLFTLHYLKWSSRETDLRELAEHVAAWENDLTPDQLTYADRKRVQNALQQFHLPKMMERGFVEYDEIQGTVSLSERVADTEFYVDILPSRSIPWGMYYLGLSALFVVVLGGATLDVYPLSLASPLAWSLFFVVVLSVSSLGHFYDNYYRMRLGAQERPPEVH